MRRLVFPTAPSPTVTHLMNLVVVILGVLTATFVLLFISEPKLNTKYILSQTNKNFFELYIYKYIERERESGRSVWIES
jgi:type IV secretory pathway VirB3-like protein